MIPSSGDLVILGAQSQQLADAFRLTHCGAFVFQDFSDCPYIAFFQCLQRGLYVGKSVNTVVAASG